MRYKDIQEILNSIGYEIVFRKKMFNEEKNTYSDIEKITFKMN